MYSANVFEPFGYINDLLITDFSLPSVLWGIDGDWMVNLIPPGVKFYPTDHCGVLRVMTEEVHPRVLAWTLRQEGIRRGFSRSLRASVDRIKRLTIYLPPIDAQRQVAEKVFLYEEEVEKATRRLTELEAQKRSIIDQYLN